MLASGFVPTAFVSNCPLQMYARCAGAARAQGVLLIQQFGKKISGWILFIVGDSNGIQVSVSGATKLHNFLCGWEGQIKISGPETVKDCLYCRLSTV